MYNAGVRIFQDSKPKVYFPAAPSQPTIKSSEKNTLPLITTPCYYTSREQKLNEGESNKIKGSKAAGILLTTTHVYAIYNTSSVVAEWKCSVEKRYKANNLLYFCGGKFPNKYEESELQGVMVGNGFGSLEKYLPVILSKQTGYQFFEIFEHFYYITNDVYGEAQLRLLCDHHKMKSFRNAMHTDLLPRNPQRKMEHDALTKDGIPVLFCCLPDIERLCRFKKGIELYNKGSKIIGRVIAFDFQVEMLKRFFGDNVEFIKLSFTRFENWLNNLDEQEEVSSCGQ
jgi:hypothetical protein